MYFDVSKLSARSSYKLLTGVIVPRPIAWVVSRDTHGAVNAAPFSFFNFFGGSPPVVCLGIGRREGGSKDTLANIRARGQFVINLVSEDLLEAMNVTAVDFPPEADELAIAGLATAASERIDVPRIADSPVALECQFSQAMEVDTTGSIVVAHVLALHICDEAILDAQRCYVDSAKLRLVGRMQSPGVYARTQDTLKLRQLDLAQWTAARSAKERV